MVRVLLLLMITNLYACAPAPGREVPLRTIAVQKAGRRFTSMAKCATYKLYKFKRIVGTQGELLFHFRIGGCNMAMDFFVRCEKWSHTCPEGKMLLSMGGRSQHNLEKRFYGLPLASGDQ